MSKLSFYFLMIGCFVASVSVATVTNQSLMQNMLNDPNYTGEPESIRYERMEERMHRLQWLANPKNLLRPGLDESENEVAVE